MNLSYVDKNYSGHNKEDLILLRFVGGFYFVCRKYLMGGRRLKVNQ